MNPAAIGLLVVACTSAGVLLGMWLRRKLPEHHLDGESRDTVKVGVGLIATMTALLLGLVTASAKNTFDSVDAAVRHAAMDVLALDRLLARYGPETAGIRQSLQSAVSHRIDAVWRQGATTPADREPSTAAAGVEGLARAIRELTPGDDARRSLQSRALDLSESLLEARWTVTAAGGSSIPLPFLAVLLFWLTITFASFGLFAPRNATVLTVLFLCALSVGGAVSLILELDGPFDGAIQVPADPLRYAVAHMNR